MKILLDPGHGGKDPGAINETGMKEKDITLEVTLKAGQLLRDEGFNILFTRDKDNSLSPFQRLAMIFAYNPDVFVSVHCNSAVNISAHGIETIYRDDGDYLLAACIHRSLIARTELADRKIKQDMTADYHRNLAVLKNKPVPSCLVEIGFMSNENDMEVIEDTDLIAEAISEGIREYAENN